MKIILTENQYGLLEAIINEVATPFSNKIQEGGFIEIVYQINNVEKSHPLEITKKYGSGQYFEVVNATGKYIVNLGGSLDKDKNTFTVIKDGQYKEGSSEGGKITAPEIVGGGKIVIKNVTEIKISDSSKKVVDVVSTTLGDEKNISNVEDKNDKETQLKRSVERKAEKDDRAKEIMKMAYEDPNLRKLLHYQPSILGGLIKLGKAKGIAHVTSLMKKHNIGGGKDKEIIKKEFFKGQIYTYEVAYPIRITHGTESINLFTGQPYKVRFDGDRFNGHVGEASEKIPYYIKLDKKSDDDTYKGTVTAEFKRKGKDKSPDWVEEKSETIVVKFKK